MKSFADEIDFIVFLITFFGCLYLGQDLGILLGITVNLCILVLSSARPDIEIEIDGKTLIARPKGNISYSAAEYLKDVILKNYTEGSTETVIIDGSNLSSIDSTLVTLIKAWPAKAVKPKKAIGAQQAKFVKTRRAIFLATDISPACP
uniref:STAS domain-containing protein n=1 Tax=Megaselia scalaris TaxID=36166 RepID=T1GU97_MEGSC